MISEIATVLITTTTLNCATVEDFKISMEDRGVALVEEYIVTPPNPAIIYDGILFYMLPAVSNNVALVMYVDNCIIPIGAGIPLNVMNNLGKGK